MATTSPKVVSEITEKIEIYRQVVETLLLVQGENNRMEGSEDDVGKKNP